MLCLITYVRGRVGGRSYVITKFYRMDSLPNFIIHGAPLARFARESSAINFTCISTVTKTTIHFATSGKLTLV